MKVFFWYCKDHLYWILFLVFSFLIFSVLCFLYQLDIEILLYGTLLCLFFFLVLIGVDFYHYKKRHDQRIVIQSEAIDQAMNLQDLTLPGREYQALLQKMERARLDAIHQNEEQFKDHMDYFTLWIHQVKLPISAMQLLLEEENLSKEKLKSQLIRINQYTDMVLAYLRMNASQTDFVFKEIDLDDAVRQSIRYFASEFIARNISLSFKETHLFVLSDEKWLVFVIEQLLSNALKYTKQNGQIRIYLQEDHKLIIEDNGIGIQASDLPRIFEKGYTGFNGRTDKKASGLGLYLCKEICQKLSCEISIDSKPESYTKVCLKFDQSYKTVR